MQCGSQYSRLFSAIVVGDINIYTNATTGITAGPCVLVPRRMAENNRSNTSSKIEIDERERAMKTSSTNRARENFSESDKTMNKNYIKSFL